MTVPDVYVLMSLFPVILEYSVRLLPLLGSLSGLCGLYVRVLVVFVCSSIVD